MRNSVKILIVSTILLSLLAAFIPSVFKTLALSFRGIQNLYLWQFFTYALLEKGQVSFGFFLELGFHMYLLWVFGTSLLERSSPISFLSLYFGSALVAGLSSFALSPFYLATSAYAVYALLVAWMMKNPYSELMLFFSIPIKSSILILLLIGISMVIDISNGYFIGAIALLSATFFAYFFSLIVYKGRTPFSFLAPFEMKFLQFFQEKEERFYRNSKIFDIQSGKQLLDDDQFMDAMLDRISRHGEDSLTRAEKKRMRKISKKKNK